MSKDQTPLGGLAMGAEMESGVTSCALPVNGQVHRAHKVLTFLITQLINTSEL